jgi:RNA polymerase sigma-70 factor, ECF subfamily
LETADKLYRRLIEPIETRMMHTVGRVLREPDDAADAFQDALARIWKALPKIDKHPNPHGYILRICLNCAYDLLRKKAKRGEVPLPADLSIPASAATGLQAEEEEQALLALIDRLPRKQGQAVLLRIVDDQSFTAIAEVLCCSEACARSHVSKGRARLRQLHIKKEGAKP